VFERLRKITLCLIWVLILQIGIFANLSSAADPQILVATPSADPSGGAVLAGTEVNIFTTTVGAYVYYTTDGSIPTISSTLYTDPIIVDAAMTVKAIAAMEGLSDSDVMSVDYTVEDPVEMPYADPVGGAVLSGTEVTLSTSTAGGDVYYTIDGSTPTPSSALYTEPIVISTTTTIKAIAIKEGMFDSGIMNETYTVETQQSSISINLNPGESWKFNNIDSIGHNILTDGNSYNNRFFDYVVYNGDGTSVKVAIHTSVGTVEVPAGGYIVVTASGSNPITFSVEYPPFTGTSSSDPALNKQVLSSGDNWSFFNTDTEDHNLLTTANSVSGRSFDFVVYNSDGTEAEKVMNGDRTSINIPAGGHIVVTISGTNPITLGGAYLFFNSSISADPALYKKVLATGDSWRFFNNDSVSHSIFTNAGAMYDRTFDYIIYNSEGTLTEFGIISQRTTITLPAGSMLIVTIVDTNPVTFGGAYNFVGGIGSSNPTFCKKTFNTDDNWKFTNLTGQSQTLYANVENFVHKAFDYVVYNSDGSGVETDMYSMASTILVPAGGSVIVTGAGSVDVTLVGEFPLFTGESSPDPALYKRTLAIGESWTFFNTDVESHNILANTESFVHKAFDFVLYGSDGTPIQSGVVSRIRSVEVPAGGYLVATGADSIPITLGGAFKFFSGSNPNLPSLVATPEASPGAGEVASGTTVNLTTATAGADIYYTIDGSTPTASSTLYVEPIIVTTTTTIKAIAVKEGMTDSEVLIVEYTIIQLNNIEKTLYDNESWKFVNIDSASQSITANTSVSVNQAFDYVVYNSNGSAAEMGMESKNNSIMVPAGGWVIVSGAGTDPITFTFISSYFTGTSSTDPALNKKVLALGDSWKYTNTDIEDHNVLANTESLVEKSFDYVVYNSDGTGAETGMKSKSDKILVPVGGYVVVTGSGSLPVTLGSAYPLFSVTTNPVPALYKQTLSAGEGWKFINNDKESHNLYTDVAPFVDRRFDFVVYNSDGTGAQMEKDSRADIVVVPAGGWIEATSLGSEPITLGGAYNFFTGEAANQALFKITAAAGESWKITNSDKEAHSLLTNTYPLSGRLFDYIIYNQNGTGSSSAMNSSATSLEVPPGGFVVVTVLGTESITFEGAYAFFTGAGSTDPAFYKQVVASGESWIFSNKDSSEAHNVMADVNNGNAFKYDYVLYNKDDSGFDSDIDAEIDTLEVPADGYLVVTNTGLDPITFGGAYTFITGSTSPDPSFLKYTVEANTSRKFVNTDNDSHNIYTNADGGLEQIFSYGIYANGDKSVKGVVNSLTNEVEVPGNGYIIVTNDGAKPIVLAGAYSFFKDNAIDIQSGQLSPDPLTVVVGESYNLAENFAAALTYSDGSVMTGVGSLRKLSINQSAPNLAQITLSEDHSILQGLTKGTNYLYYDIGAGKTWPPITVEVIELKSLQATPKMISVELGESVRIVDLIKIYGIYSDGSKREVTHDASYSIANSSIAKLPNDGTIVGLTPDITTMKASYKGQQVDVKVNVVQLRYLEASLKTLTLGVNEIVPITPEMGGSISIYGIYTDGSKKEVTYNVSYSIVDSNVAMLPSNGTIVTLRFGITTMNAKYKDQQVGITLDVRDKYIDYARKNGQFDSNRTWDFQYLELARNDKVSYGGFLIEYVRFDDLLADLLQNPFSEIHDTDLIESYKDEMRAIINKSALSEIKKNKYVIDKLVSLGNKTDFAEETIDIFSYDIAIENVQLANQFSKYAYSALKYYGPGTKALNYALAAAMTETVDKPMIDCFVKVAGVSGNLNFMQATNELALETSNSRMFENMWEVAAGQGINVAVDLMGAPFAVANILAKLGFEQQRVTLDKTLIDGVMEEAAQKAYQVYSSSKYPNSDNIKAAGSVYLMSSREAYKNYADFLDTLGGINADEYREQAAQCRFKAEQMESVLSNWFNYANPI
jgi:plastocyanin